MLTFSGSKYMLKSTGLELSGGLILFHFCVVCALTYFGELSPEDTLDYDRVKDLMLKRFAHTEDVLRGKFRSARPDLREDLLCLCCETVCLF